MTIDLLIYTSDSLADGAILTYTNWMKKFITHCEQIAGDAVFDSEKWFSLIDNELKKWSATLIHYEDSRDTFLRFETEEFLSLFLMKYS